jgi:putative nucleotidyltransferase with HDIG domain
MDMDLVRKVEACSGKLSGLKTPDEAAIRRHGPETDGDGWSFAFGSPYAVDVNKILDSRSIRRLSGKTQVVVLSRNRHVRDRLSHSFDVAHVATTAARILGLNEDLCRAGALGHDIGHTPFGHLGEKVLTEMTGQSFRHEVFSVVLAQHVERQGAGLNLTKQVLRAIRLHSRGSGKLSVFDDMSAEESLVMYADKIAYIFADYNDLFLRRAVPVSASTFPKLPELEIGMNWFGATRRERIFTCLAHLCLESVEAGRLQFAESEVAKRFLELKDLMYGVYPRFNPTHLEPLLRLVYKALGELEPEVHPALVFAMMSDSDVNWLVQKIVGGESITDDSLSQLSIGDVLPDLRGQAVDFTAPDLDW